MPAAESQDHTSPPRILFVCVGNTCRSVMAEYIAKRKFAQRFSAESAGLRPGTVEDSDSALHTLKRLLNVDASNHQPRDVRTVDVYQFNVVITMTNSMDATAISLLALVVAALAFTFGSGAPLQLLLRLRTALAKRAAVNAEVDEFLHHSAMFLEGLPHFIRNTWDWGPSVPNYGADGSFPPDTPAVRAILPDVCATVGAVLQLYSRHSSSKGTARATVEEVLAELRELDTQFWAEFERRARSRWPLRWRAKVRRLRALRIPQGEHDRIRQLGTSRRMAASRLGLIQALGS